MLALDQLQVKFLFLLDSLRYKAQNIW